MTSQMAVSTKPKKTSRIARGLATNELVFSAYQGTNDEVFPHILALHVPKGGVVADVTYGRGVFWKNIDTLAYDLRATDLTMGVDCRKLPYVDRTIDCVVFDPPYMHTPGEQPIRTIRITRIITTTTPLATRQRSITRLFWIYTSKDREKHFAS